jgi:hypothetical protein
MVSSPDQVDQRGGGGSGRRRTRRVGQGHSISPDRRARLGAPAGIQHSPPGSRVFDQRGGAANEHRRGQIRVGGEQGQGDPGAGSNGHVASDYGDCHQFNVTRPFGHDERNSVVDVCTRDPVARITIEDQPRH